MPWLVCLHLFRCCCGAFYYFVQKPAPLQVRRLGWNELAQAIVFCVLFITTFAVERLARWVGG